MECCNDKDKGPICYDPAKMRCNFIITPSDG
jgi:hypothetical protein